MQKFRQIEKNAYQERSNHIEKPKTITSHQQM